jgi:hypothetical protein
MKGTLPLCSSTSVVSQGSRRGEAPAAIGKEAQPATADVSLKTAEAVTANKGAAQVRASIFERLFLLFLLRPRYKFRADLMAVDPGQLAAAVG